MAWFFPFRFSAGAEPGPTAREASAALVLGELALAAYVYRPFVPTPSVLSCVIGATAFRIMGFRATERTGGEASPFSFRVTLSAWAADPQVKGSEVTVIFTRNEQSRTWVGTLEGVKSQGAEVEISCLMPDAYLSRRVVTTSEDYADVGAIMAAFVDDCGAPLTSDYIDDELGVITAIPGDYKSLLEHLGEWSSLLGLLLWVDADYAIHLTPAGAEDLGTPTHLLYEAAP